MKPRVIMTVGATLTLYALCRLTGDGAGVFDWTLGSLLLRRLLHLFFYHRGRLGQLHLNSNHLNQSIHYYSVVVEIFLLFLYKYLYCIVWKFIC